MSDEITIAIITAVATILAALIGGLSPIVVAKFKSSQEKNEPQDPDKDLHIATESVLTPEPIAHREQVKTPLVLTVLVAAITWVVADWLFATYIMFQYEVWFMYLARGVLLGAASGGVLWWAKPTIKGMGALIIIFGWVIEGFSNYFQDLIYYVDSFTIGFLITRTVFAFIPGCVTGWVLLRQFRPFPIGVMFMIGFGWVFARLVGGSANWLLMNVFEYHWHVDYATSGALGIWITLAVANQLD